MAMLIPNRPALVLAPMEGITDAPMRALQGEIGSFSYSVAEFVRVSVDVIPSKVFRRDIPEVTTGARTVTGLPVQVQILGGDPERMALTALSAIEAGATAIDINFGCPAPMVNRHDGGAAILQHPLRIRSIVRTIRDAVPHEIPVSAKLRLGWDDINDIDQNARMAAEGGANWITIHGRTRTQNYIPPAYWEPIGRVRKALDTPVIANGEIWTLDDFKRCQDITGSIHFMIGRGALANPLLSSQIAGELGLPTNPVKEDWPAFMRGLAKWSEVYQKRVSTRTLKRLKQWLNLAAKHGGYPHFETLKKVESVPEFFRALDELHSPLTIS